MKILIISDNPERKSFRPIEVLKDFLQNKAQKKVDLFALSPKSLFLNGKVISKRTDASKVLEELEAILRKGLYSLYIISLEAHNLKKIFPSKKKNFLDMVDAYSKNSTVFVFGAPSMLNNIKENCGKLQVNLFLKPRPGVAKITKELKEQISEYI